jgi:hypothetical protein
MVGPCVEVGGRWGVSLQPIDLYNRPTISGKKASSQPSTMILLNWFSKANGNLKFKYDHCDSKWLDINTIFTTITLSY